MYELN